MQVPTLLRSVAACLCGYLVIALLTTLFFEALLGGVGYHESSRPELVGAGFGALVSGLAGGATGALVGRGRPLLHGAAVAVLVGLDTVFVIAKELGGNPVWFDVVAGGTIVLAAVAGGWVIARRAAAPAGAVAPG